MAHSIAFKPLFFLLILLSIGTFFCKSEYAEDQEQDQDQGQDQSQVISRALVCFNKNVDFNGCEENYRLTQSGIINVPREQTDEYCNGPCLGETSLLLNCIDNLLSNFLFYNRATVHDIRQTLKIGCGHTSERGNFDVSERLRDYSNDSSRRVSQNYLIYLFLSIMILGCGFVL